MLQDTGPAAGYRPSMAQTHGTCADRFSGVREMLEESLEAHDVGASVAVYLDGEPVVDLWGGYADAARTTPWQRLRPEQRMAAEPEDLLLGRLGRLDGRRGPGRQDDRVLRDEPDARPGWHGRRPGIRHRGGRLRRPVRIARLERHWVSGAAGTAARGPRC